MIKSSVSHLLVINRLMLAMILLSAGCVESDTDPKIYERDKCYEGIFIQGDCPSWRSYS